MKIWFRLSMVVFLPVLLAACAGGTGGKHIEPGDKIGDVTISTGVQGNFTYGFEVECAEPNQENAYTCYANVGELINVSTGLRASTDRASLDEVWSHSNYQVFIEDMPVDLTKFGTIDYNHPTAGMIRFANVVITADKPATITVRDSGIFDNGEPFSSTSTYIFSVP